MSIGYLLMKSSACALSCVALCMSANIRMSQTLSTVRFEHNASSHITLSLSRSYWKKHRWRQKKLVKNTIPQAVNWHQIIIEKGEMVELGERITYSERDKCTINVTECNEMQETLPQVHAVKCNWGEKTSAITKTAIQGRKVDIVVRHKSKGMHRYTYVWKALKAVFQGLWFNLKEHNYIVFMNRTSLGGKVWAAPS